MGNQRAPRSSLRRLSANAVLVVALVFGGASGVEGAAAATHPGQVAAAVAGAGAARPQVSPRRASCLALRRALIRLRVRRLHSRGQSEFLSRVIDRLRDRIDRECGGARAPSGA